MYCMSILFRPIYIQIQYQMLTHWKTIQNYVGCNSVEELQKYLNAVYAIQVPLIDYQTQHPILLSKLLHIFQMILLYYLDSNEQLQKCHEQIAEDIDRTDREISHTEDRLREEKLATKSLQKKLQAELKQKSVFIEKIKQQLIRCNFCDKISTTDSDFDYHMKKYHQSEFTKKEVDLAAKAIQNQLLSQQLTLRLQQMHFQAYMTHQFQILQKAKQQLGQETEGFLLDALNVDKKIGQIERRYIEKIKNTQDEIEARLTQVEVSRGQEDQARMQKIEQRSLEIEAELIKQNTVMMNRSNMKRLKRQQAINPDAQELRISQLQSRKQLDDYQKSQTEFKSEYQLQPSQSNIPSSKNLENESQPLEQVPIPERHKAPLENHKIETSFNAGVGAPKRSAGVSFQEQSSSYDPNATPFILNQKMLIKEHEEFQNLVISILMDRTNKKKQHFPQDQVNYALAHLERQVEEPLTNYQEMDLKALTRLYDFLQHDEKITADKRATVKGMDDSIDQIQREILQGARSPVAALNLISHSRQASEQIKRKFH